MNIYHPEQTQLQVAQISQRKTTESTRKRRVAWTTLGQEKTANRARFVQAQKSAIKKRDRMKLKDFCKAKDNVISTKQRPRMEATFTSFSIQQRVNTKKYIKNTKDWYHQNK